MRIRGMLGVAFALLAFPSVVVSAEKVDKASPDYLRVSHAGSASFSSESSIEELFPQLFGAARNCYSGSFDGPLMPVAGGFVSSPGAERMVIGFVGDDLKSAYIRIEVQGVLNLPMIQIDLEQGDGQTLVNVYHRSRNLLQRNSLLSVERWLAGDLDFCLIKKPKAKKAE